MPKQNSSEYRKISVDLPIHIWESYQEIGKTYGMKIKQFILGAFEAVDFLDKFLSETLTEDQIVNISPLLRQTLQKYETLYCGKVRSRNLDKKNVIYFDRRNDLRTDPDLQILTDDIVRDFQVQDEIATELLQLKKSRWEKPLIIR